jgi:hypothetical protein
MKVKKYITKTRGNYREMKKEKFYLHEHKFVFGVTFETMSDLLGVEATCNLFKYYNKTNIYIPSIKTIRRRIEEVMIRHDYDEFIKAGIVSETAIQQLAKKYQKHVMTIKGRLGKWTDLSHLSKTERRRMFKLRREADEKLVDIVQENIVLFKKHGLI